VAEFESQKAASKILATLHGMYCVHCLLLLVSQGIKCTASLGSCTDFQSNAEFDVEMCTMLHLFMLVLIQHCDMQMENRLLWTC